MVCKFFIQLKDVALIDLEVNDEDSVTKHCLVLLFVFLAHQYICQNMFELIDCHTF